MLRLACMVCDTRSDEVDSVLVCPECLDARNKLDQLKRASIPITSDEAQQLIQELKGFDDGVAGSAVTILLSRLKELVNAV